MSLIERCRTADSKQFADILDNCELFRTKVIILWDEFLVLKLVKESELDKEILDSEKITLEFTDTKVATGSETLAIGSSNVESNISTHMNTNSDSIESSDEDLNDLVPLLKAPPVTDEIKKEIIDVNASNVVPPCKIEPSPVVIDNKLVVDEKNLLSLDRLDASGERLADREKPKAELNSSIEGR